MKRFTRALVAMRGLVVIGSVVSIVPQKNATATGGRVRRALPLIARSGCEAQLLPNPHTTCVLRFLRRVPVAIVM